MSVRSAALFAERMCEFAKERHSRRAIGVAFNPKPV
jgi:hypothetical protein